MKFRYVLYVLFYLLISPIFAQQEPVEFLPGGLQFIPIKSNHQEARIGVLYYPENGYLKVDIGNNIDLIKFHLNSNLSINLGIEFMAYALSTNYQGKRLQIDALDGFFGGHTSAKIDLDDTHILSRLRIIHNSAHFVDGHYDNINNRWRDDINPIPFTQDFGELTVAHVIDKNAFSLKYFGSVAYSTLVRPHLIEKYSYNFGLELYSDTVIGETFDHPVNVFYSNYNRYAGMPDYKLSTSHQVGLKFGDWYKKGLVLYLSYYYGNNILSEYYFQRDTKFGIGFTVDFN